MLDAYIIDAIKREEEARERAFERRRVWLELPMDRPEIRRPDPRAHEDDDRGPIVIPLNPSDAEEDAA